MKLIVSALIVSIFAYFCCWAIPFFVKSAESAGLAIFVSDLNGIEKFYIFLLISLVGIVAYSAGAKKTSFLVAFFDFVFMMCIMTTFSAGKY